MTRFLVAVGDPDGLPIAFDPSPDVSIPRPGIRIEGTPAHEWLNSRNELFFVFGRVHGLRDGDGTLRPFDARKPEHLVRLEDFINVSSLEGRFVVVQVRGPWQIRAWTDAAGRMDLYVSRQGRLTVIASDAELASGIQANHEFDALALAHSLTVYGGRPPKRETWWKNVSRLGVGECLELGRSELRLVQKDRRLEDADERDDAGQLDRYANLFLNAIQGRLSSSDNIVYMSSGWDSSAILATLVHFVGPRSTRAVIGRMKYSRSGGILNSFEIERAKQITDYFGLELEIVDLDYVSEPDMWLSQVLPLLRRHSFANLTAMNHWILARAVARASDSQAVVFSGEMSDGLHNLGFSQYTSVYHPSSFDFREYADKMSSYLFGGTFLNLVLEGSHESCPVWHWLRSLHSSVLFDDLRSDIEGKKLQFLSSFFLSGGRLPLFSGRNKALLTIYGQAAHAQRFEESYLREISEQITPKNIYSALLDLYPTFHWQGATVQTLEYTAEEFDRVLVNPFQDLLLVDFMRSTPENWGRGLELRPTKYPLKQMLRKRVDYPYFLQQGPHSYRYDVEPGFSLVSEVLYDSSLTPYFRDALGRRGFEKFMDPQVFDLDYARELVGSFMGNRRVTGRSADDLVALALHALVLADEF